MSNLAIVCDVMKGEFDRFKKNDSKILDYVFLEQHLHDNPDKMREKLQGEIDKVGDEYTNIILSYGLCSNGVVGLKSSKHTLIIPRVDDCISLFFGSKERYMEEFKKDPGTYYLCKGWIEYGSDPYRGYLVGTGQQDKVPKEFLKDKNRYGNRRYPEAFGRKFLAEIIKNYKKVILINNNDIEKVHRDYARDMVAFMGEILNREVTLIEIKGSSRLLKKMIDEDWDNNEFIKIKSGQEILQEYFLNL